MATVSSNSSTGGGMVEVSSVGGYECESFHPLPDHLQCSICMLILRNPQRTKCCRKRFCSSCILQLKRASTSFKCPNCRSSMSRNFFDDVTCKQVIEQLQVNCSNKRGGCNWRGIISDIDSHLKQCHYQVVSCPNDCSESIYPHELDNHLKDMCPHRLISCIHCHMTDKYRVITGTHVDVCPDMPIPCPNKGCNEVLLRKLMEEHRGKCFKEILQCPYGSFIQCQEKVKRENLAQHEHDNVTQHLKMAIEKIKELSQENTKLFTLMSPSTRILKLEKFTEHKEKSNVWYSQGIYTSPGGYKMCLSVYANGNGGATGSHVSCFVHLMRGEYDHLLEWPFKGEVMVELLNQLEDKRHEREIFQFNDSTPIEYRCRVLSTDIGRGGGVQKFIPHPQLNFNPSLNCQYLKDDTVYFRMSMKVSSLTKPWLIN